MNIYELLEGEPLWVPPELLAAIRYHRRLGCLFQYVDKEDIPKWFQSDCLAISLHACQSVVEALDRLAELTGSQGLADKLTKLPHLELLAHLRNLDIHGHPLLVPEDGRDLRDTVWNPRKPLKLWSSDGVAVSIQGMVEPEVRISPKRQDKAGAKNFGTQIAMNAKDGKLYARDASVKKGYVVDVSKAVRQFFNESRNLIAELCNERRPPEE